LCLNQVKWHLVLQYHRLVAEDLGFQEVLEGLNMVHLEVHTCYFQEVLDGLVDHYLKVLLPYDWVDLLPCDWVDLPLVLREILGDLLQA